MTLGIKVEKRGKDLSTCFLNKIIFNLPPTHVNFVSSVSGGEGGTLRRKQVLQLEKLL